jgi:hypothetical protein
MGIFAAIEQQVDQGGREALLAHLLKFDLSRVNLRQIPRTAALLDQKIASLPPEKGMAARPTAQRPAPVGCGVRR